MYRIGPPSKAKGDSCAIHPVAAGITDSTGRGARKGIPRPARRTATSRCRRSRSPHPSCARSPAACPPIDTGRRTPSRPLRAHASTMAATSCTYELRKATCDTETSAVSSSIAASIDSTGSVNPSGEGTVTTRAPWRSSRGRCNCSKGSSARPSPAYCAAPPVEATCHHPLADRHVLLHHRLAVSRADDAPDRLPTVTGISHQPSSQARMPRAAHVSVYSRMARARAPAWPRANG